MELNKRMKRNLTKRYIIALAIIACMMIASYTILTRHISSNTMGGYIINISGMQRMLSQRIGLMAHEIQNAPSHDEAEIYIDKMQSAIDTMRRNHAILSTGLRDGERIYRLSSQVYDAYYGDLNMNARLSTYLDNAQNYIDSKRSPSLSQVSIKPITSVARNGLLSDLNAIVSLYEAEERETITEFIWLETIILLIGLLALILEMFLIFQPMVKTVTNSFERLRQINHELTEFSYRISHDLRAPIVTSLGLSDLCRQSIEKGDKDSALKSIDFIKTSMSKLNTLIDDIINLNKVKVVEVKSEPIIIQDIITDILGHVSKMENFPKIEIRTVMNVTHAVHIKRVYLKQSLENLVTNAIKYCDLSKPKSFIEISVNETKGQCTIHVIDNGLGIPEENRDDLFKMFKRFHPKTSFGSGLGLYLVSENVKALGGSIHYHPLPSGTEFTLKFPI